MNKLTKLRPGEQGTPRTRTRPLAEGATASQSPTVESLDVLQRAHDASPGVQALSGMSAVLQRKPNVTGMPDQLKLGLEQMSGMAMDDVRVHYNSPEPAQLQAHAHTQGSQIHIAPGQEHQLPHEAWHVVQQKQGRVRPTGSVGGKALNDDPALEQEADRMGARAAGLELGREAVQRRAIGVASGVVQRVIDWEDLQWVVKSKPAFRFHTQGGELKKQVESKKISGHKHPLYYLQDIFKKLDLGGVTSLDEVPEERREDVTREYEQRLLAVAQSSLAHVTAETSTPAGFLLAELEKSDREKLLDGMLGKDEDSNLITGLGGTPFGAYLGDLSQEPLEEGRYVLSGFDTFIDSPEKFEQEKYRLASLVAEYIKLRGKRPRGELSLRGQEPVSEQAIEELEKTVETPDLTDYQWAQELMAALELGRFDYEGVANALRTGDGRLAGLGLSEERAKKLLVWLDEKVAEQAELL